MKRDLMLGYLLADSRYEDERLDLIRTLREGHGINIPTTASVKQISKFLASIELNASYNIKCVEQATLSDTSWKLKAYDEVNIINDKSDTSNIKEICNLSKDFREFNYSDSVNIKLF